MGNEGGSALARAAKTAARAVVGIGMLGLGLAGPQESAAEDLDVWFLPETGHYYAIVGPFSFDPPLGPGFPAISWSSAKEDAESRFYQGERGGLATINVAAENDLIEQKLAEREDCFSIELAAGGFVFRLGPWIGAMRPDSGSPFAWLGEGPFAQADGTPLPGAFVDFVEPPEPNGQNFVNYIDFLARPSDPPELGWADCNDSNCFAGRSPVCYVVEFDAPRERSGGCGRR